MRVSEGLVTLALAAVSSAWTAGVAAAAPAAPPAAVVFSGPTMGSRYTVRVVMAGGDEAANEKVRAAIERELALVDQLLSGWNPQLGDLAPERARLDGAHPGLSGHARGVPALPARERASAGSVRRHRAAARRGLGLRPGGRHAPRPRRRRTRGASRPRRLPPARARPRAVRGQQGAGRPRLRPVVDRRRLGGRPDRARHRGSRPPRRPGGRGRRGGGAGPARGRRALARGGRVAGRLARAHASCSSSRTRASRPRATTASPGPTHRDGA